MFANSVGLDLGDRRHLGRGAPELAEELVELGVGSPRLRITGSRL